MGFKAPLPSDWYSGTVTQQLRKVAKNETQITDVKLIIKRQKTPCTYETLCAVSIDAFHNPKSAFDE